ncbi:MAG: sigma-54 dependent transcriptional regulator [Burkholderiaceae bacterium]
MSAAATLNLLVVDDEPDLRTLYELTLLREGYDVESASTVEQALEYLKGRAYSAVITDMRLPDGTGLDILRWLVQGNRAEKAIVITAYGSAENAVEALRAGAYDYLTKPVDLRQFRAVIGSALGRTGAVIIAPTNPSSLPSERARSAPREPAASAAAPAATSTATPAPRWLTRMAGRSAAMEQVRGLIEKVARSMAPVLIDGESGTGKELVARSIHEVSVRCAQPFIAVNCSAIPEQLLEAEFFGYRKGAFTGAAEDREGFFQAANGGTLFLDEIGDLPLSMQSKLLRAIQERQVRPVGAVSELPVNVRLLSATHKDLGAEVHQGQFRQDLYYRLNVIQIRVPPLRERMVDLGDIAAHVLERLAREAGAPTIARLTSEALEHLARYAFPGNVRELENLLHRAVALSAGDWIGVQDLGLPSAAFFNPALAESARAPSDTATAVASGSQPTPIELFDVEAALPNNLAEHLDAVERDILERALQQHRFNRTAAGASLGLSLRQMRYRMARLGVGVGAEAGGERE